MTQDSGVVTISRSRFDFDTVVNRSGSNSLKWGGPSDDTTPVNALARPLPMWVADMDFRSPPVVIDALHDAVAHGIYGYAAGPTKNYLNAVTGWQQRRFGWDVPQEWVVPVASVIGALKTILQA